MQYYLVYTLYLFVIIIMIINFVYMFSGVITLGSLINNILDNLMKPLLCPIRYMLKHSILKCIKVDLSSYIILIVLLYLQALCKYFLG